MSYSADMANTAATHRQQRYQSTNMLMPECVDPMAPDPRFGFRVAPTDIRAAMHSRLGSGLLPQHAAASPWNSMQSRQQTGSGMQSSASPPQMLGGGGLGLMGMFSNNNAMPAPVQPPLQQMSSVPTTNIVPTVIPSAYGQGNMQRAQINARGLCAATDMYPMMGDRPPQSPKSPRAASPPGGIDSRNLMSGDPNYRMGFGLNLNSHYSFRPDVSVSTRAEDQSMDDWEAELFQSYRKIKYYGTEEHSEKQTKEITQKFAIAAHTAYDKLEAAVQTGHFSEGLEKFFRSLNGFENLTRSGFKNLDRVFEGRTPDNLFELYSILHVGYAISQATKHLDINSGQTQLPSMGDLRRDLETNWRQCLPPGQNKFGYNEQEVFDDLTRIMMDEMTEAFDWIQTRNEINYWTEYPDQDVPDLVEPWDQAPGFSDLAFDFACIPPRLLGPEKVAKLPEPDSSRAIWKRVLQGPMFSQILKSLDYLSHFGPVFDRLCGLPFFSLSGRSYENARPDHSQQVRVFKNNLFNGVLRPILMDIKYPWLVPCVKTALNMVILGAISTLRDFENYLIGLTKSKRIPIDQRERFVQKLLLCCLTACTQGSTMFAGREISEGHEPYTRAYAWTRFRSEKAKDFGDLKNVMLPVISQPKRSAPREQQSLPRLATMMGATSVKSALSEMRQQLMKAREERAANEPLLPPLNEPYFQGPSMFDTLMTDALGGMPMSNSDSSLPNLDWAFNNQAPLYSAQPVGDYLAGLSAIGFEKQTYPLGPIIVDGSPFGEMEWMQAADFNVEIPNFHDGSPHDTSSLNDSASISDGNHSSPHSPPSPGGTGDSARARRKRSQRRTRRAEGRVFICDVPGCGAEIRGSKYTMSNSNLLRHKRSAHPDSVDIKEQEYRCPMAGCTGRYRGARGRENLKTHRKQKHPEMGPFPDELLREEGVVGGLEM